MKSWFSILGFSLPVLVVAFLIADWAGGPDNGAASGPDAGSTADRSAAEFSGGRPETAPDDDRSRPAIADELTDEDYYNDFSAPLGPEWEIYDSPGHAGWGLRRPSAIGRGPDPEAAGGSVLTITAEMGTGANAGLLVSGGIKLLRPQIYGRYTMRIKVDKDPAEVTSGVALLWPTSNRWPEDGEIDILETWASRATRSPVESNLHWLDPDATRPYGRSDDRTALHLHHGVDGSQWHVYQLEWRRDLLSISIDGGEPAILSTDPDEIADWNMEPTLQLDAFSAPSTPELQPVVEQAVVMSVDYLVVQR